MTLEYIKNIYETTKYNNILHEVNGLFIPLNKNWKKIAVALSGGADSALLTYLLSEIITRLNLDIEIHIISNIRCWKTKPWQRFNSIEVFKYIQHHFNNIKYYRHENFVPPEFEQSNKGRTFIDEYEKLVSGDTIELRAFAEFICHIEDIDAYYNAVTKNPNINFKGKLPERDIEPNINNFHLTITEHMNRVACHPFRFVSKKWIFETYMIKQLNELYRITRSCEGEFNGINYKNYIPNQHVPICDSCFWCLERNWGEREFSN